MLSAEPTAASATPTNGLSVAIALSAGRKVRVSPRPKLSGMDAIRSCFSMLWSAAGLKSWVE